MIKAYVFHKHSPARSAVFQAIETAIIHFNAVTY